MIFLSHLLNFLKPTSLLIIIDSIKPFPPHFSHSVANDEPAAPVQRSNSMSRAVRPTSQACNKKVRILDDSAIIYSTSPVFQTQNQVRAEDYESKDFYGNP